MLINTLLHCVFYFFSRHQQLTKLLSRYINEPIHHKPRESHGKYYSIVLIHLFCSETRMMMIMTEMMSTHCSFSVCIYVLIVVCLFSPVLYYWTLLFPTLSGAAILLIAAMLGGYGGLICGLLFPWLARSIFMQYHRMTTYQRFDRSCGISENM